ncbi:MAG: oxygen-independent coproporphyrinogen III oxidase [Chitinophagaceae bacterium]|nr:oxygen-independent coproporphyrinogen III oxidase [Chitinophagaceae bacterium]MCW5928283.1 oxygen-independent coproporphyrinogen III oxidase [Chitinophagaceae bacterium]
MGEMPATDPLIARYNVPCPRYTSYPTVPYWEEDSFAYDQYLETLQRSFEESNKEDGISLYIHLPFCESLCTFCGCNKRITRQHEVESPYIEALLKEWKLYGSLFTSRPRIRELHLGGGTPTFFSPANLQKLIERIFRTAVADEYPEFSFEGHPNNTGKEHLTILHGLGFNRVSFGVQDYSPTVQKAINRIQPFENVRQVTDWARETGYESISHDLVFGLPFQQLHDILDTVEKTLVLRPDRLSLYSYAHVPWIKGNGQRGFKDEDVPRDDEKRALYLAAKQRLLDAGYIEVGMDHFALPGDALATAFENKTLHRNFMGYTASRTQLMVGLGVSSIGDSWYGFAQNQKNVEAYHRLLDQQRLPITRGHLLTEEDLVIRRHILNLMCRFYTSWQDPALYLEEIPAIVDKLAEMETDGLLTRTRSSISVTEKGKAFIRNICMAFDLRLHRKVPQTRLFSLSV